MMISLSADHVRLLRLRAQRLLPHSSHPVASVAEIVREMCGIQAQDAAAAPLAVRVRSAGLVAADVELARAQERAIVRAWGPRGTLHLLATEDLGWLLPLLGPVFVAGDQRRREELGLDEDTCVRGIHILRNILTHAGPLTRAEIVEQLAVRGIRLEGQARPHFLYRAALEGVICCGPDHGAEPGYVLLSDWVEQERTGPSFSEMAAYAELTRRYLGAYGPATPRDQAAWSGLPLSKIQAAWKHIADQLLEVEVADAPAWILKECAAWLDELNTHTPIVRLLPRFDIYLLGYQRRELAVPPQHTKRINAGGGMISPTLMVDGRIVGVWKSTRKRDRLDVVVEPFELLAPQVHAGLEAEIVDLARFLEIPCTLHVMRP